MTTTTLDVPPAIAKSYPAGAGLWEKHGEAITTAITLGNGTNGGLAANYTLTQPTLANVLIAQAPLTLTGLTGTNRPYNGSTVDALKAAEAVMYQTVQQQAQLLAFVDDFRLMAGLFLALVPFLLIMKRPRVGGGPPPPAH